MSLEKSFELKEILSITTKKNLIEGKSIKKYIFFLKISFGFQLNFRFLQIEYFYLNVCTHNLSEINIFV